MKSILVIPPSAMSPKGYRRRTREIAEHLAEYYQVYYLSWGVSEERDVLSRAKIAWGDLRRRARTYKEGPIDVVELPILRRPLWIASRYNRFQLSRLISKLDLDYVLSASTFLHPLPNNAEVIYCYDFRDIPTSETDSYLFRRFIRRHVGKEVERANLLVAVSQKLLEDLEKEYGREIRYLPNGASLSDFEFLEEEALERIRGSYDLNGKFVVGYVGYFGGWSGLEFAVEVFRALKKDVSNAVLFVVGPGEEAERCRKLCVDEKDVIFTGGVHQSEVHNYFACIDVGILSSPLVGFRDYSFPIKVIEYSAARKIVVSTPVDELKRVHLPNVYFAEYGSVQEWVDALKKAKEQAWQPAWDETIGEYDWGKICEGLKEMLEGVSAS